MCENARFRDLPIDGLGPHPAAPVPALIPAEPERTPGLRGTGAAAGRLRLWDLPHKYHCPIIGTCLHVDELRRLAQKAGCRPKQALSDFDVHVSFVAAADSRNPMSQAVQRLLERRYAAIVKRFCRARAPQDLEHLWNEALANGEVQGAFWAVMSHAHAPSELRTKRFCKRHAKPCVLLKRSGVGAFALALSQLTAAQAAPVGTAPLMHA